MTKQELVRIIKDNFTSKSRTIDLTDLDFGSDSVNISRLKTKGTLYQNYQKVGFMLYQNNQEVGGSIHQNNQTAGIAIYQDYQKVKINLYQHNQTVGSVIYQHDQEAEEVTKLKNMTKEDFIELLDKYDSDFSLQTGEEIQAIYFYDFGKLADELVELFSIHNVNKRNNELKNMTKQELVQIIKENFANEDKRIDISGLDFEDYDVNIGGLKTNGYLNQDRQRVGKTLYQDHQEVEGDIFQDHQKANNCLYQDLQEVKDDLYQNNQKVGGNLYQYCQRVKGSVWQHNQEVGDNLYQNYQEVKGDIRQDHQKAKEVIN